MVVTWKEAAIGLKQVEPHGTLAGVCVLLKSRVWQLCLSLTKTFVLAIRCMKRQVMSHWLQMSRSHLTKRQLCFE